MVETESKPRGLKANMDTKGKKIDKLSKSNERREEKGVIYIGHLPWGFEETGLREYFTQFGEVKNLRVARSRKTGNSKGYAFLKFAHDEVAKIAAETMDNYLMFGKLVKCRHITNVHPKTFMGKTGPFDPRITKKAINKHNKGKSEERLTGNKRTAMKKYQKKIEMLKKMGINYQLNDMEKMQTNEEDMEQDNSGDKSDGADSSSESDVEMVEEETTSTKKSVVDKSREPKQKANPTLKAGPKTPAEKKRKTNEGTETPLTNGKTPAKNVKTPNEKPIKETPKTSQKTPAKNVKTPNEKPIKETPKTAQKTPAKNVKTPNEKPSKETPKPDQKTPARNVKTPNEKPSKETPKIAQKTPAKNVKIPDVQINTDSPQTGRKTPESKIKKSLGSESNSGTPLQSTTVLKTPKSRGKTGLKNKTPSTVDSLSGPQIEDPEAEISLETPSKSRKRKHDSPDSSGMVEELKDSPQSSKSARRGRSVGTPRKAKELPEEMLVQVLRSTSKRSTKAPAAESTPETPTSHRMRLRTPKTAENSSISTPKSLKQTPTSSKRKTSN